MGRTKKEVSTINEGVTQIHHFVLLTVHFKCLPFFGHTSLVSEHLFSYRATGYKFLCYRNEPNVPHLDLFLVPINHKNVTSVAACFYRQILLL